LSNFDRAYSKKFGSSLQPSAYGYASLNSLLHAIPEYVFFKDRGQHRAICPSRDLSGEQTNARFLKRLNCDFS
jgi:hypothetical protein